MTSGSRSIPTNPLFSMSKFIFGFACGAAVILFSPWAPEGALSALKPAATPLPAVEPVSPPPANWMFDKSRGTLNQGAHK